MKILSRGMMLVAMVALLLAPMMASLGCGKPSGKPPVVAPETAASLIRTGTAAASYYGLQVYGKKNSNGREVAQAVASISIGTILPYLDGNGTKLTSGVVNEALKMEFAKLPAEVKLMISVAAGVLDAYLPAPKPDTFLNPEQVGYIRAFFTGLADGANLYSENSPIVTKNTLTSTRPGNWLKFDN